MPPPPTILIGGDGSEKRHRNVKQYLGFYGIIDNSIFPLVSYIFQPLIIGRINHLYPAFITGDILSYVL